jgi:hypothetical protein
LILNDRRKAFLINQHAIVTRNFPNRSDLVALKGDWNFGGVNYSTEIFSSTSALSSSVVPVRAKELVTVAVPICTAVMT